MRFEHRIARLEQKAGLGEAREPLTVLTSFVSPDPNIPERLGLARIVCFDGRPAVELKPLDGESNAQFLLRFERAMPMN